MTEEMQKRPNIGYRKYDIAGQDGKVQITKAHMEQETEREQWKKSAMTPVKKSGMVLEAKAPNEKTKAKRQAKT